MRLWTWYRLAQKWFEDLREYNSPLPSNHDVRCVARQYVGIYPPCIACRPDYWVEQDEIPYWNPDKEKAVWWVKPPKGIWIKWTDIDDSGNDRAICCGAAGCGCNQCNPKNWYFGPRPPEDRDVGAEDGVNGSTGAEGSGPSASKQEPQPTAPQPLHRDPLKFRGHLAGCVQWTRVDYRFCSCFKSFESRILARDFDGSVTKIGYECIAGVLNNPTKHPEEPDFSTWWSDWD